MARFRNHTSGVVVGVDDSKADRFGSGWEWLDEPSGNSEPVGYVAMKVADLRAEITRRNADRGDDAQLPVDGVKADLVATLEADDQAAAGPEG